MGVRAGSLQQTGVVFLGGGLGALTRAALTHAIPDGTFPLTTFSINVVGSFLLGFLLAFLARSGDDVGGRRLVRLGVGTGVIGGFTTYSAFAVQTAHLALAGDVGLAALYAVGSVAVGVGCAGGGSALATRVTRLREKGDKAR